MAKSTPSAKGSTKPKKTAKKAKKSNAGRPTKMTPKRIKELENAFLDGLTDEEACIVADISHQTLYNYCKEHPEFLERKEQLKRTPVISAKRTIARTVKANPKTALKFLERNPKTREEWAPPTSKVDMNMTGKIQRVPDEELDDALKKIQQEIHELSSGAGTSRSQG